MGFSPFENFTEFNTERRIHPLVHTRNNKQRGIIKGITFGESSRVS
nr:MAG TPA: hypothetical protein [Caudoviricetes sp.]